MNWRMKDAELYLKEKEYIDTAVVPLVPISFGTEMKQAVEKGEFIQLLSIHLEKQFKGRMFFLPAFTYLSEAELDQQRRRLYQWADGLKAEGFKHIFFLTSDSYWKTNEENLGGVLLHVPSVSLGHLDESYIHSIMEDQIKQLMNLIVRGWQAADLQ